MVNRLAGNDTALVALEKIKAGDIGEYVALSPEKGRRKSPGAIGGHIKTVADALGYNNGQSLDLAQYVNGVHFA
ncbi:hypothetical protein ACUHMQ_21365, partial [Chitinimonas sp. PSY-7]|uniref:hypothetical protein n=1 Tax=Chitinimonas sp. PSY-7 TaxID=3459088 RepID=UPI00403FE597